LYFFIEILKIYLGQDFYISYEKKRRANAKKVTVVIQKGRNNEETFAPRQSTVTNKLSEKTIKLRSSDLASPHKLKAFKNQTQSLQKIEDESKEIQDSKNIEDTLPLENTIFDVEEKSPNQTKLIDDSHLILLNRYENDGQRFRDLGDISLQGRISPIKDNLLASKVPSFSLNPFTIKGDNESSSNMTMREEEEVLKKEKNVKNQKKENFENNSSGEEFTEEFRKSQIRKIYDEETPDQKTYRKSHFGFSHSVKQELNKKTQKTNNKLAKISPKNQKKKAKKNLLGLPKTKKKRNFLDKSNFRMPKSHNKTLLNPIMENAEEAAEDYFKDVEESALPVMKDARENGVNDSESHLFQNLFKPKLDDSQIMNTSVNYQAEILPKNLLNEEKIIQQ